MQESLRSASGRAVVPRISDKLQDIYSEEAHHFREEEQLRKRLFSQIIQKSDERIHEKKSLEKQLQRNENQQNDLFWRNEEERRRELSRRRRREVEETRRANNSQHHQQLHKSMCEDYSLQKSFRDDLNVFISGEQRRKEEKERYLREAMMLEEARQEKKKFDRELELMIDHKKQHESQEQYEKRAEFYSHWRSKHFEDKHPEARRIFDEANARKEKEGQQLEELIAVKGGMELNQRVAALRAAQVEELAAKKEQHVKQLKQQVEENTYKAAIDRYLELNYERSKMHEMGRAVVERDQLERQHRKEVSNEHLSVLRGQMKPRSLLPEPDRIEFAGIGSPAHIGKIVHDDRLKQLKWIERNFLKEVKQI